MSTRYSRLTPTRTLTQPQTLTLTLTLTLTSSLTLTLSLRLSRYSDFPASCECLAECQHLNLRVECAIHLSPHTSRLTPHASHLTPHASRLTPHTSHLTPPGSSAPHPLQHLAAPHTPLQWHRTSYIYISGREMALGSSTLLARCGRGCAPHASGTLRVAPTRRVSRSSLRIIRARPRCPTPWHDPYPSP